MAGGVEGLPAGYGVGADDGTGWEELGENLFFFFLVWQVYLLHSQEIEAGIFRVTTVLVNELCTKRILYLDEAGLGVGGRQGLGELLDGRAQTIIGVVARGPEGVASYVLGSLDDLQDGVVGGDVLEADAVVVVTSISTWSLAKGSDILGVPPLGGNLFGQMAVVVPVVLAVQL